MSRITQVRQQRDGYHRAPRKPEPQKPPTKKMCELLREKYDTYGLEPFMYDSRGSSGTICALGARGLVEHMEAPRISVARHRVTQAGKEFLERQAMEQKALEQKTSSNAS